MITKEFNFEYIRPEHGDIYDVFVEVIGNTLLIQVDTSSDRLYRIIEEKAYEIWNDMLDNID